MYLEDSFNIFAEKDEIFHMRFRDFFLGFSFRDSTYIDDFFSNIFWSISWSTTQFPLSLIYVIICTIYSMVPCNLEDFYFLWNASMKEEFVGALLYFHGVLSHVLLIKLQWSKRSAFYCSLVFCLYNITG